MYEELKRNRDNMRNAVIGVSVGTGVVILCLIGGLVAFKLLGKKAINFRPSVQGSQQKGNGKQIKQFQT